MLRDRVEYVLPASTLLEPFIATKIERDLAQLFAFRHRRTREDLVRHAKFSALPRRTIAVTGCTGAVGRQLCAFLTSGGHRVIRLVRGTPPSGVDAIQWNPLGSWDASALEGVDAVVHLAGENIAQGRWSKSRKREIIESRRIGTTNLSNAIAKLAHPPSVMVCASAVGYYGNCGSEFVDERSSSGDGFLAEVTRAWEASMQAVEARGIRTVKVRMGVVVNARTGVVGALRLPFLLGLGGRVGSGRQGMSWIHIDDLIGVVHAAIEDRSMSGPINAVAPEPVTQMEFARSLARVLRRPCLAPLPAGVVRAVFGELGSELLLAGQFVRSRELEARDFQFGCRTIDEALAFEFGWSG